MQPYVEELPYAAAKAGVLNLAKGLSKAYGPDGVLVNAVGPAFIATPMTDAQMEKKAKEKGVSFDEAIQLTLDEERPGIVAKRVAGLKRSPPRLRSSARNTPASSPASSSGSTAAP